jgi:hypothetical protein
MVWARSLAEELPRDTGLEVLGRPRGEIEASMPLEEWLDRELRDKGALELAGKDQWLSLTVEGEAVLVEAGESPARPFEQFRVEFRRGEEAVVSVSAEDGVARLTPEHFAAAQEQGADRVVIGLMEVCSQRRSKA